jgi:hypothetical protein
MPEVIRYDVFIAIQLNAWVDFVGAHCWLSARSRPVYLPAHFEVQP